MSLIRNLLDTARLERGLFTIEPQECDITALVSETAAFLSTQSTPIEVHAPAGIIVHADPDRLRQVIENLLGNAIQHSPPNASVQVSLEIERQLPDAAAQTDHVGHNWVRLVIEDQGEGIPPELLPRLFERYVRGQESRGIGLGLYVAARIIQAHDGTLTVESSPGHGARFILRLPLIATP